MFRIVRFVSVDTTWLVRVPGTFDYSGYGVNSDAYWRYVWSRNYSVSGMVSVARAGFDLSGPFGCAAY